MSTKEYVPDLKYVTKHGVTHAEIRIGFGEGNILVIVAIDGWHYKSECVSKTRSSKEDRFARYMDGMWYYNTEKFNVRFSMNNSWHGTFEDYQEFMDVVYREVENAKQELIERKIDELKCCDLVE